MPQTPLGREYTEEELALLDTFDNLALLTPSLNSRLSNYSPKEKAEIALGDKGRRVVSLKYELMLQIADSEGWGTETCKAHGEAMKELLLQSLETRT